MVVTTTVSTSWQRPPGAQGMRASESRSSLKSSAISHQFCFLLPEPCGSTRDARQRIPILSKVISYQSSAFSFASFCQNPAGAQGMRTSESRTLQKSFQTTAYSPSCQRLILHSPCHCIPHMLPIRCRLRPY